MQVGREARDVAAGPSTDGPSPMPVLRAVCARVRFLDAGLDTAKGVRQAFNSHGGAARYVWNAAHGNAR